MSEQAQDMPWVAWYERAKNMSLAELPAFIDEMAHSRPSYEGMIHATAAASTAVSWAFAQEHGLTGFMAGAVMWEFMRHWNGVGECAPARLLDYKNLLYPQYGDKFTSISSDTWEWAQEEAKRRLSEESVGDWLREHWESIAAGKVPFGLVVRD